MSDCDAESIPLMSSGSMMLRQRPTMVPQARQQLQHSSAMYEVLPTRIQGQFTCSVSRTHCIGGSSLGARHARESDPGLAQGMLMWAAGPAHSQPGSFAISLRRWRLGLQEEDSGTPPPTGWKGSLSRAMSRKPSMVRGRELSARMTYTAGLSNIQEARAPPPPGKMGIPAASPQA